MTNGKPEEPKLVGGAPCLDFTNTVNWRGRDNPEELVHNYRDLIEWSHLAGILDEVEKEELQKQGVLSPKHAELVYRRGIELREAIYKLFRSVCEEAEPAEVDLIVLNQVLSEALSHMKLTSVDGSYSMEYTSNPLESILWKLATNASDLLISENLARVKRCASEDCSWLFLDLSRNRSRRWCRMEDCGNRMKARRHYRRTLKSK